MASKTVSVKKKKRKPGPIPGSSHKHEELKQVPFNIKIPKWLNDKIKNETNGQRGAKAKLARDSIIAFHGWAEPAGLRESVPVDEIMEYLEEMDSNEITVESMNKKINEIKHRAK